MQAITTKYLGATNTSGSKIKAKGWRGSHSMSYDPGLSESDNHILCAQALIDIWNKEDDDYYMPKYGRHDSKLVVVASGALPDITHVGMAHIVKHTVKGDE